MKISILSLILLAICVMAWFSLPFMSINMLTLDDQPTAAELFGEELTEWFDLSDSPAYLTALAVIIGIALAFFCALVGLNNFTRILAFLSEIPLAWGFYQMYLWTEGNEFLFGTVGHGFWIIAALLLGVVLFGGKERA